LRLAGACLLATMVLLAAGATRAADCDIVFLNGRVMDPETKFDDACLYRSLYRLPEMLPIQFCLLRFILVMH
jgi:hypothetical protein